MWYVDDWEVLSQSGLGCKWFDRFRKREKERFTIIPKIETENSDESPVLLGMIGIRKKIWNLFWVYRAWKLIIYSNMLPLKLGKCMTIPSSAPI